jgi:hypothetical protein
MTVLTWVLLFGKQVGNPRKETHLFALFPCMLGTALSQTAGLSALEALNRLVAWCFTPNADVVFRIVHALRLIAAATHARRADGHESLQLLNADVCFVGVSVF